MNENPALVNRVADPWWRRLVASRGLFLIALTIGVAWLALGQLERIGGAAAVRDRLGASAPVVMVPVHAVVSVSPFPGELVAVANSMMFGLWTGMLMSWCGWMLGAVIQYYLARQTAKDFDFDRRKQRLPAWLLRFPVGHPIFLICVRWIPCGGHVVNASAGVFRVPLWRHLWCAAISLVPVAALFAILGAAMLG